MVTVGIDEVGRGCWAGPLLAGAVMLPAEILAADLPKELRDSKLLTKKQRDFAAGWVYANALAVGLGWVWPAELDRAGLSQAVKRAMERALEGLRDPYDEIIVDGNINYFAHNPKARAVIKADATVPSVSAASIVAKVARDAFMANLPHRYAGYEFDRHVGYGTAAHIAALQRLGVSDLHRQSFKPIRAFMA